MGRLLDLFTNKYPYTDFHEINLSWLLETVKDIIKELDSLDAWKVQHEAEYQELKTFCDQLESGDFPPAMYNTLHQWVVDNSASIMESLTKMVFFGITDDGYFVAYIPATWDDITFNTAGLDLVVPDTDYGTLILSY